MITSYILYNSIIQTKNGGQCFDNNGQQQFSCQCFENFIGSRCETNLCDYLKCENGGICIVEYNDLGNFQLKCDCLYGFDGDHCQREISCATEPCKDLSSNT